jgi:hypothetical protein
MSPATALLVFTNGQSFSAQQNVAPPFEGSVAHLNFSCDCFLLLISADDLLASRRRRTGDFGAGVVLARWISTLAPDPPPFNENGFSFLSL